MITLISGQKDYSDVKDVRLVGKVYGRTVLATIMSVIVYVSITFLFLAMGTRTVGYQIYELGADGQWEQVGDPYYYQEGEGPVPDIELEDNQKTEPVRSELSAGMLVTCKTISQIFTLFLLLMMPYGIMKERGEKDGNLTRFEHKSADVWRGLRVGLFASIPSFLLYIVFVVSQCMPEPTTTVTSMFRLANYAYTPILDWLLPQQTGITVLGAVGSFLLLLLVPAICALGYYFGYKRINLMERLVYRKK